MWNNLFICITRKVYAQFHKPPDKFIALHQIYLKQNCKMCNFYRFVGAIETSVFQMHHAQLILRARTKNVRTLQFTSQ